MKEVIMLKGIQGSGKSTYAKQLIDENPGKYKRINNDDIRLMLDNGKFTKQNEKFVDLVRNQLIVMALDNGFSVILDNMNLHAKHEINVRQLIKGKANLTIKDFTDVPLETCIERDLKRPNSIGEKVIRKAYNQYIRKEPITPEYIEGKKDIVICDLDGTLCLLNGRNPYDASTCNDDILNEVVYSIIKDRNVIFVSGREDKYKPQTINFLLKHGLEKFPLFMRKSGDMRKDSIVKEEIYNDYIKGKYNVLFTLDDRDQMIILWRSLGLVCLQVAEGDF